MFNKDYNFKSARLLFVLSAIFMWLESAAMAEPIKLACEAKIGGTNVVHMYVFDSVKMTLDDKVNGYENTLTDKDGDVIVTSLKITDGEIVLKGISYNQIASHEIKNIINRLNGNYQIIFEDQMFKLTKKGRRPDGRKEISTFNGRCAPLKQAF